MARPLRIEYEGAFYHVTARGNERRRIYYGKADYEKFKTYLEEAEEKYGYLHSYLLELSRYIHLNPVRAKLVERPEDYPYSSYSAYISKKKNEIVYRDFILGMASKTKEDAIYKYKNFVDMAIGAELEDPLMNVYAGTILGGTRFIKEALN